MTEANLGEAPEAATPVDAGAHQQLFYEEPLIGYPSSDFFGFLDPVTFIYVIMKLNLNSDWLFY